MSLSTSSHTTLSSSPSHLSILLGTSQLLKLHSTPPFIFSLPGSSFLNVLKWFTKTLTSTSGSEYSYYTYTLSPSRYTFLYIFYSFCPFPIKSLKNLYSSPPYTLTSEEITPASLRQINRSKKTQYILIHETPQIYSQKIEPWINGGIENGSINWLYNVIDKKKEVERILFDNEEFMINVDTKWKSHSKLFTDNIKKDDWKNYEDVVGELYCLAYFKERGVKCLRDLEGRHIQVLKGIKHEGLKVIKEVYGVEGERVRVFIHYHPQFYHLHVHFNLVDNDGGVQVERAHLIEDVIEVLDGGGYGGKTLRFRVGEEDDLRKLFL